MHLVGYSLGGRLVRRALALASLPPSGRVVLIGTPNAGSALADWLKPIAPRALLPCLDDLVTVAPPLDSPVGSAPPVGVIAGTLHGPSGLLLDGPSDGRVTVESARSCDAADVAFVRAGHTSLPLLPETATLVERFLTTGRFAAYGSDAI